MGLFYEDTNDSGNNSSGGGSRGGGNSFKDEQDMADFLSSLDEITKSNSITTPDPSTRWMGNLGSEVRSGSSGGATSPSFGADLFFGTAAASSSVRGTHAGATAGLRSNQINTERAAQEPPEWLKDFQSLDVNAAVRDAPVATATESSNLQAASSAAEEGEILGAEPEILDGSFTEFGSSFRPTSISTSGLPRNGASDDRESLNTTITRHDSRRKGATPAGPTDHYWPPTDSNTLLYATDQDVANDAHQLAPGERLDWPGTLDMLGLAESDGRPQQGKSSDPTLSGAGLSASEQLPTMPPPPSRAETFRDFIEVRDPRNVSQWPKPGATGHTTSGGGGAGAASAGADTGAGGGGTTGKQQGHRPALPTPLRTVEVYLRPDVTWESVSDVYMAVMLSRGLVVREQTEKMVTAEKAANSSGDWATVTLRVGVTRDKLRTLVMQFYADTRAPILSLAGTMARFSGRAGDELYSAIRDALVERRMPLSFLATDAHEISLDPHYVRDLVAMYAHENLVNLTRYALPLEEFVREEEERSARLVATLLPKYHAHGIMPPRPTRSKSLSSYPLTTRRPPVSSCGVEEARAVVERAREHARSFDDAGSSNGGGERTQGSEGDGKVNAAAEAIRSLIRATWEDVKAWCDEEAEARVRRKDSQVRDRLLAVERHREALIAALRDGAGGSAALTTPSGRDFAARFRPMAEEAVLAECKAVYGKRVGQLYLTCTHLCFHSSVLGFTSQKVLPLFTVASVSHASSSLGMDVVTVVDRGGESHSFAVTAVEASFPERFHDLLQQVLLMCKADASRRAAKEAAGGGGVTGDPGSLYNEPDEVQILARVQRLAKAKQQREARERRQKRGTEADTTNTSNGADVFDTSSNPFNHPPTPPYTKEVDGAGGSVDGDGLGDMGGVFEGGDGVGGALGAGLEEGGGVGVNGEAGGGDERGSGRPASMMAMGIQAFLEESQRRSFAK